MTRQRHVAIIGPMWYPLPPQGYGGVELVVHLLVTSLRRLGVRVTVYGCEGSAPGTTVMAPAHWANDLGGPWYMQTARESVYHIRVLEQISKLQDVDVIHDNAEGASLIAASVLGLAPVVHTNHGPVTETRGDVYRELGARTNLVAISEHQRSTDPSLNWAGMVHNAVDVDSLRVAGREEKEGYLLCLARISQEKGQHRAIEVARRTGRRLVLAGKVGEPDFERRYFHEMVEPHIDGDRVVYIGNVFGPEKTELIARASALIHACDWAEPFGLALIEAMASGTPCVAIALGAVPELVINGQTGLTATDVDGLVEAVTRIDDIDNLNCAAVTRARYHPDVMAQGYLDVYEKVIADWTAAVTSDSVINLAGEAARRAPVIPPAITPIGQADAIPG